MSRRRFVSFPRLPATFALGVLAGAAASPGWSQTAAVTRAEDAFGQRVGDESIGLYDESQVRGFSLENAGNYRLDGHYFVRSGELPDGLLEQSTVRVGASALQLDFPAPSGLVEFSLRRPGEGRGGGDATVGVRWAGSAYLRAHGWAKLGDGGNLVGGIEASPDVTFPDGTEGREYSLGLVAERRVGAVVLRGLAGGTHVEYNGDYGFLPAEPLLPAPIRGRYELFGPPWGEFERTDHILGATAEWDPDGGLSYSAAHFHARTDTPEADFTTLALVAPDRARAITFIARDQWQTVDSSELKAAYSARTGGLDHHLSIALRRRESSSRDTSGESYDLGEIDLGERRYPEPPRPSAAAAYRLTDVSQTAFGLSYQGTLWDRARVRVGSQWTEYLKEVDDGAERHGAPQRPWLYDASATLLLPRSWLVYVSYVRGLEEGGIAPNSAVNRNEVLPAIIAEQLELGFRTSFSGISLTGAVFEISKPTAGFDDVARFALFGQVRHRGVELSLAGSPVAGLSLAAGVVAVEPRVTGPSIDAGLASARPLGVASTVAQISANYSVSSLPGFSVETTLTHTASIPADQLDRFRVPARTALDLSARYAFDAVGLNHVLRLRVEDIAGRRGWEVSPGGTLMRVEPRSTSLQLTTEF